MQEPLGLAHVVDVGRAAGDVLAALIVRASGGAPRAAAILGAMVRLRRHCSPRGNRPRASSASSAPPISVSALRSSARAVSTRYAALARMVVDRREVLGERRDRVVPRRRVVELRLGQRLLGRARALRGRRHAAKGDARAGDARPVDAQLERAHHGRNVLVEALGDLVAAEMLAGRASGCATMRTNSPGCAILLAVVDEEVLERHRARLVAALQSERRAERDQRRRQVADRRAIGDVAADRAGRAHLLAEQSGAAARRDRGSIAARYGSAVGVRSPSRRGSPLVRDPRSRSRPAHAAEVDDLRQLAQLLGDPQPDVGRARDDAWHPDWRSRARRAPSMLAGAAKKRSRVPMKMSSVSFSAASFARAVSSSRREPVVRAAARRTPAPHRRSADSRCSGRGCRRSSR